MENMSRTKILDSFTDIEREGRTAKYMAELRHRLRRMEAGLCILNGCSERPEGKRMCEAHRLAANQASRGRRLEKKLKLASNTK